MGRGIREYDGAVMEWMFGPLYGVTGRRNIMLTEEMKVALEAAPDRCLITGLEKCKSYMIDGNVVYLPRPAYDAYTLPEYDAEEKAFYRIKYDMDNDFVEVENGVLCTLDDLIVEEHPNLLEIKRFYNIPELDFVYVFQLCECDAVAAYTLEAALSWYKNLTDLTEEELYEYDSIELLEHDYKVNRAEGDVGLITVLEILEKHWKGEPFIAVTTGGY